ncbi:MAG: long-chain fatty acid--CoA ligase [Verrucomicrobiae bacterium]|nr:long-chain fatty acid--CoA ligase [Verrucomicrobiae bacterium]
MLYDRWRQVVQARSREVAVVDLAEGQSLTFNELDGAAGRRPATAGLALPSGTTTGFVLTVLRAWRDDRPVCPLDRGQSLDRMPAVPTGVAHLKLTSATTGPPRLVAFTAQQLAADADQIVAGMGLNAESPNLGVISLAHSYGFSNLVLPLLLHGIPLILGESPLPEAIRRAAVNRPPLTLPAVPALWRSWHDADAIPANVRLAISAGAPLSVALEESVFRRQGLKIHNFYGATECGGIAYDATAIPRRGDGGVGTTLPGVRVGLDPDGCLEVRSPSVALGYVPPEPAHLGHGRYRSRDVAELDEAGVRLLGRLGDLINLAGRKVAPETVEAVLATHPDVEACLVFGAPDLRDVREERLVAVIAPRPRATVSESDLRAHALRRLPAWQVPREWRWVAAIPVNGRGKVSRLAWRQRYLAGDVA